MNKKLKLGLSALGAVGLASAAFAANHTGNGEGIDGVTFWTIFSQRVNSSSINVTSPTKREFTLAWDNQDVNEADYATGGGWRDVNRPTTVKYSLNGWKIDRVGSDGAFGIYGWACNNVGSNDNVEFYIVDAWLSGAAEFKPFDNFRQLNSSGKQVQVATTHGTYRIWQSPSYSRANACPGSKKFHQVWAIRTAKRSVGTTEVPIDFKKLSEVMDNYGYFTNNLRYLVVGVDAFRNTKGTIKVRSVNKS
jgi:hypothetical protein